MKEADGYDEAQEAAHQIGRMVDFRIPLPWIIGGALVVTWALISMWFSVNQIKNDLGDMKSALTTANVASGKVQLLEYRLQTLESDVSNLKMAREHK